jgi:hypothetical protein
MVYSAWSVAFLMKFYSEVLCDRLEMYFRSEVIDRI